MKPDSKSFHLVRIGLRPSSPALCFLNDTLFCILYLLCFLVSGRPVASPILELSKTSFHPLLTCGIRHLSAPEAVDYGPDEAHHL